VLQVDRRDAELLREAFGDVFLGDEAELDERFAELAPVSFWTRRASLS